MTLPWVGRVPHVLIGRLMATLTLAAVVYLVVFTLQVRQPRVELVVVGTGRPVCADFASQADAQAALRQFPRLDLDKDGLACEGR